MLKYNSTCDVTSQSNTPGNSHANRRPRLALKKQDSELVVVVVVFFMYLTTWHPALTSLSNNSPREKLDTMMMVFVCVLCI